MPLLDHFHPPLEAYISWTTLHSGWATRIADDLNERWLPRNFVASEYATSAAHPEIDVGTYEQPPDVRPSPLGNGGPAAAVAAPTWTATAPLLTVPIVMPRNFEVRIHTTVGMRTLVAVVELVSPSNKDRPTQRQAFAAKTAAYLLAGVSVAIIDIVTHMRFNLHNETMHLLESPAESFLPATVITYAAAYRPKLRDEQPELDIWHEACAVGRALPTMPLRLTGDLFVPVDLESTYMETLRRRRLI